MSKIADAIRRVMRREARPIGFATTSATKSASMVLLARPGAEGAEAVLAAGADAVLLTAAGTRGQLWGSERTPTQPEDARTLHQSGGDFVVFDAEAMPAAALLEDGLGYIMRLSYDAPEAYLRGVEGLPLDAVLAPALEGTLTVQRTLDLRRLAAFVRRPLLLPVAADISAGDLEALRDCGVVGVLVEGAAATTALRNTIDALPPRRRTRDGRGISVATQARGDSYEVEELPDRDDEP